MAELAPEQITESPEYSWAAESTVEDGVIRNVLLCGNTSRNGYDIPSSAFGDEKRVKTLYENLHVFVDHLPPEKLKSSTAAKCRSSSELAGFIKNVRLENGKPRGDIHTAGCPKGETIREFARAKVPNVGLSHVALYRFSKDKSKRSVESVDEVCSVDCVIRPATTNSFTEQTRMADVSLESVQTENTTLKGQLAELRTQLAAEQTKVKELDTRVVTLKTERDQFETDLNSYKQKETIANRRTAVESELKAAGLDVNDKDICSPVFIESLVAIETADGRKSLIEDRVSLAKLRPASEQHRGSGERKSSGSNDGDSVSKALNSPNLFA